MKSIAIGVAAVAALSVGAIAHAQSHDEKRLMPEWLALDTNHDGKVSGGEVTPALKRADDNGDGTVSFAEYWANDNDPGGARKVPVPANVKIVSDLNYAGTSDPRQTLDVFVPRTPSVRGPLPVVVFIHGGGWSHGGKIMARSQVLPWVDSGRYASVSINYRLSSQAPWPAQINDSKAAIRWIRANAAKYGFDPKRICALGSSAGGHLVAELGLTNGNPAVEGKVGPNLKQSSDIQCVIDMFGPVDLRTDKPASPNGPSSFQALLGGKPDTIPAVARQASPITYVSAKAPPFLIIHGTKDPLVDYQQSVRLDAALRQAGAPVLFQTIDGGGHGEFGAAVNAMSERIRLFLERTFYDPNTQVPTDTLKR